MLSDRKWLSLVGGCGIAILLGAPAVSLTTGRPVSLPLPQGMTSLAKPTDIPAAERGARDAAINFVKAMANKDAPSVWMFASEEDQDAFGTEDNVYAAFAETFPLLAEAQSVAVVRSWQDGDTPFVEARVVAKDGSPHFATIGFWLSDAGDWQVISCDIGPATDAIASF